MIESIYFGVTLFCGFIFAVQRNFGKKEHTFIDIIWFLSDFVFFPIIVAKDAIIKHLDNQS